MTPTPVLWQNRVMAGQALATLLSAWSDQGERTTVIGLPRGGVVVAAAVAQQLHLPLSSWAVRKLALPGNPEFAIGAIAAGDVVVWNPAAEPSLTPQLRQQLITNAWPELVARQQRFNQPPAERLQGQTLIVVDDGVATGMTVRAALIALRQCRPRQLVLAVPVLDRELLPELRNLVDDLVVARVVDQLQAVGRYYANFDQVCDSEVCALLEQSNRRDR